MKNTKKDLENKIISLEKETEYWKHKAETYNQKLWQAVAERDESRKDFCITIAPYKNTTALLFAEIKKWDCFKGTQLAVENIIKS